MRHELTNSAGVAHGGVAAAMADVAVGMAINRHFGGKRPLTTVEMKINYFRPVTQDRIFARSRLLRIGSTLCVGSVDLTDADRRLHWHRSRDLHAAGCTRNEAARVREQRRKNAAQGASPGLKVEPARAPKERKNHPTRMFRCRHCESKT